MKLRNKKTGEIVDVESLGHADSLKGKFGHQVTLSWKIDEHLDTCKTYNSLAELNEEWEDYEEPKEYWYMDYAGFIHSAARTGNSWEVQKKIGNCFETKEEAEKAVEKLKAWKRLKDKGFRFNNCKIEMSEIVVPEVTITAFIDTEEPETLNLVNLLFGGEK